MTTAATDTRPTSACPTPAELLRLRDDVFQLAREKGWWDECSREVFDGPDGPAYIDRKGALDRQRVLGVVPEKIALIHSEIAEAFTDFIQCRLATGRAESGKPVGFWSEIADVAIRALDLLGALDAGLDSGAESFPILPSYKSNLLFLHSIASAALEEYRADDQSAMTRTLEVLVRTCFAFASRFNEDLSHEIAIKHAFNKTRSFRHGGKKC